MNMKIKSIIYLVFSITVLFSCDNDKIENEVSTDFKGLTKTEIVELSNKIGQQHNEGLKYIHSILKNRNNNLLKSSTIQKTTVQNLEYETLKSETISFVESDEDYIGLETEKQMIISEELQSDLDASYMLTDYENLILKETNEISLTVNSYDQLVNSYIIQVENIMKSDDANLLSNISQINQIEQNAINNINDSETLLKILSTCSVAKNSLEYWNANISEWYALNGESTLNKTTISYKGLGFWPDWKKVAFGDAAGAVIGASRLFIGGPGVALAATGPSGWTAIGLVVGAHGIMGSASAFVAHYW